MKDTVTTSCLPPLDFPEDAYSLMFPPSPDQSIAGSSCKTWVNEVDSSVMSPSTPRDKRPRIKTKTWLRKEKIGQGAQGSIYRCEEKQSGQEVAVKVIWTKELPPLAVAAVKREVKTMKRLRHKHLVRYLQATEKKQTELRIYMEYAAGGSLSSRLLRAGALPLALVKRYTRQVCQALQYLHQNGIAHRDIKCANILLAVPKDSEEDDLRTDVKLGDFGTFKIIGCASLVQGLKGTPHWMAPEVIRQEKEDEKDNYDHWFRADVWSLGCAVLEMITGHSPYEQFSNPLSAMYQIVSSDITPTIPTDVTEETASFLQLCLQRNPQHRATITQLLAHPFIRETTESKPKAKSSKHRLKRQGVARRAKACNQQSAHFVASTHALGKDLIPEPEPHEDSATQSHVESPNRLKNLTVLSSRASIPDNNTKTPHPPALRENTLNPLDVLSPNRLRLRHAPRREALETISNPTVHIPNPTTSFVTSTAPSPSLVPIVPTNVFRGVSAGSRRLPRLIDRKLGNGRDNPSTSPIRLRRIATAPTASNLETTENVFPDTLRLPPLSLRPCNSSLTS